MMLAWSMFRRPSFYAVRPISSSPREPGVVVHFGSGSIGFQPVRRRKRGFRTGGTPMLPKVNHYRTRDPPGGLPRPQMTRTTIFDLGRHGGRKSRSIGVPERRPAQRPSLPGPMSELAGTADQPHPCLGGVACHTIGCDTGHASGHHPKTAAPSMPEDRIAGGTVGLRRSLSFHDEAWFAPAYRPPVGTAPPRRHARRLNRDRADHDHGRRRVRSS